MQDVQIVKQIRAFGRTSDPALSTTKTSGLPYTETGIVYPWGRDSDFPKDAGLDGLDFSAAGYEEGFE